MNERYLTSFEDQTTALDYTNGDTTLVSPQVSLIGDEVVYSKKIPNESKIRFAKDEETGRLYFVVDGVYYDVTVLVKKSIPAITYGEVDLGLSVKWADRNVGAETPQDNGAYFSWGNVEGVVYETTKISEDYLIEQALGGEATPEQIEEFKNNPEINAVIQMLISGEIILISGTTFDSDIYVTTFGGQYTGSELDAEHDAATVNMGDDWRMPTSAETVELVENTEHYYIGEDGSVVAGPFDSETEYSDKGLDRSKLRSICFVKKGEAFNYNVRSNFIEIPFAGRCFYNSLSNEGSKGHVWSSSARESSVDRVRSLSFDYDGRIYSGNDSDERQYGLSVRGVRA
jgi:hypothetical protein